MKDDKQKIVVGGIYEVDVEIMITKHRELYQGRCVVMDSNTPYVIVVHLHNNKNYVGVKEYDTPVAGYFGGTHKDSLVRQVGYDATYSAEYQEVESELKKTQSATQACKTIIEFEQALGRSDILIEAANFPFEDFNLDDTENHLSCLVALYEGISEKLKQQLETIKEKSWMESEAE